jgi:hypothetical protein
VAAPQHSDNDSPQDTFSLKRNPLDRAELDRGWSLPTTSSRPLIFFFTFFFTLGFKEAHVKRLGKFHGKSQVLVCCRVDVLRVGTGIAVYYLVQEDEPRERERESKKKS